GARAGVERHGGRGPASPRALAALPGVGAYTAAAIASIAFGQPVPAVDGNVERVLARHRGITANVKSGAGARAVREAAAALLVRARAGDFNQALMDLGATLCTAKAPRCAVCPVAEDGVARRSGRQAELPVLPERRAPVDVRTRVALLRAADGAVVVRRIGEREVNRGQLDLPGPGPLEGVPDAAALQAWLDGHLGAGSARIDPEPACEVRHAITWHRIRVAVHVGTLRARRVPAPFVLVRE